MAKTYQLSPLRKLANTLLGALLRLGVPLGSTYLLTVKGRKSGRRLTTPVTLVEKDGQRWLVAPYGEVNWVRNARAAGEVTMTRGRRSETVSISELGPTERAPILKEYLRRVPIVQPFFDVTVSSSLEAFVAEAPRHPVFRLVNTTLDRRHAPDQADSGG
jgi:deazaflavin-dependent oxidoreductase (nitroreductase family)